jgi:phage/plasmid-associated DNA primase
MFGRFNNLLENKVLVVINETEHNDTMKTIGKIKDSITKPINKIEYKGLNSFEQQNNVFYVYLTNNNNPIPLSASDRRICAIECNNEICNNGKYFDELHKELNSGTIDRVFFDFLNKLNVKDYDFTNNRPITKYYKELKLRNKPIVVQFLCDSVIDSYHNQNIIEFTGSEIYDEFKKYLSTNGYPTNYSSTKFGLDIKEYDSIQKVKTKINNKYVIDKAKLTNQLIKAGYYEEVQFIDD